MSEVKEIVEVLNAAPFKKNLTLLAFDGLEPLQLLQLLNDVFTEISSEHKVVLREEDPEETLFRMLNLLRSLKYKPPPEIQSSFRQGLVQGHREVIYPVLSWILPRLEDLKKRAHLARFLAKIDIPPEFLQNEQVAGNYAKYEELIGEFKEVHKEMTTLKKSGYSVDEIKRDITSMTTEKEQLEKRTERMKKKVESLPNFQEMLVAARELRLEHEREGALQQQREEQRQQLMVAEEKLQRTLQQLKEVRSNSVTGGVDGLLARLDDEHQLNTYLSREKLPQALDEREKVFGDLQRILEQPAMTRDDLDVLHKKIQDTTREINKLVEKRMVGQGGAEDKLALFRKQATLIARKKESVAETLTEQTEELAKMKLELEKQKAQGRRSGPKMLKPEEFKRYVAKLRGKSTTFKARKAELGELRAEAQVLARTEALLKEQNEQASRLLSGLASKKGVAGFLDVQDQLETVSSKKSELDEQKGRTLEDISEMVKELTSTIAAKKTSLAPLIKELRTQRQIASELDEQHQEAKSAYEAQSSKLESSKSQIEQEVRGLREEVTTGESRTKYLENMGELLDIQLLRAKEEMQAYVASDASGKRPKCYRDAYTKKIQEQENLSKTLREKQRIVKDSHEPNMQQQDMWGDLLQLFTCKKQVFHQKPTERAPALEEQDRLVL